MSRKDLLPDAGPVLSLRQALYRAARDYKGGINTLALHMGVSPDALQKALNPKDVRPIKPEWIEEITAFTRDPQLLAALTRPASAVAYVVKPVSANRAALEALGGLIRREGEFIDALARGAADRRWERHELEELQHHGFAVIAKYLGIMAGAQQAVEEDAHG